MAYKFSLGALNVSGNLTVSGNVSASGGGPDYNGDIVCADDFVLSSDASIIKFGADKDVSLTHVADTGLLLNSDMQLQFRDSTEYINSDADGYLNVRAATGLDLNINGTDRLQVSSNGIGVTGGGTFSAVLKTDDTTDATSKTDGSLQTDGGLSVAKAIYNGTAATLAADSGVVTMGAATAATVSAAGIVNVNNTTDATSKTDGSLQTDGGLSVAKAIYNGTAATFAADSGVVTIGSSTALGITAAGIVNVNNTTDASSKTDGSLQTDGGLSVAKAIYNGTAATLAADSGVVTMGSSTALTVSAAGVLDVANTTAASAIGTAALVCDGGASVALDLLVGDDITLLSDAAVLGFGADTDTTLTHVADQGVQLNSTRALMFGDTGTYINQGSDGQLDLTSDGQIDLNVGAAGVLIKGTTPKLTIGDAGAEDTSLVFDGNAQDYYVGLDDTDDALKIGVGSAVGTTTAITVGSSQEITLDGAGDVAITVADDSIYFRDSDGTIRRDTWADIATAIAGDGITATAGVLSTDAASGAPAAASNGVQLSEGWNYLTGTVAGALHVSLPNGATPGDVYGLKARAGLDGTRTLTIAVSGAHTIDGETSVALESPYSAIRMVYLVSGSWGIF